MKQSEEEPIYEINSRHQGNQRYNASRQNDARNVERRRRKNRRRHGDLRYRCGRTSRFNALIDEVAKRDLENVKVTRAGCIGMCKLEPIVEVFVPGEEKVTYVKVDADKAVEIIENISSAARSSKNIF